VWKVCFHVSAMQRLGLFSDDFCSDSTLILTRAVKQCMDIGVRPRVRVCVCGDFEWF
jgi:hypothetical protein